MFGFGNDYRKVAIGVKDGKGKGMKLKEAEIKKARIEMVPLIDSFFLILVYFIYSFLSMSIHKGVHLNLPQSTSAVQEKVDHHDVSISKEGLLYVDGKLTERSDIKNQLQVLYATSNKKDFNLYIYGDKDAPYGEVVCILDIAKGVGIGKVFIETRAERN